LSLRIAIEIAQHQDVKWKVKCCDGDHAGFGHRAVGWRQFGSLAQEIAMATLMKKTGSRMARWFKKLSEQRDSRPRWYDVDHCGM
jgi:hypothetical protein